jgi:SAM-dependent methyltransferase
MISDWLAFWDGPHCIYVNARHKDVHYHEIAQQIADLIGTLGDAAPRVLDYGCGEALHAGIVAAKVGELILCDGAPGLRAGLHRRFAGHAKIRVLSPHDVERLPAQSLDIIVLHSVAQYLTADATAALFLLFHRLLKPLGTVIVGDIIPPMVPAATDALALLRFAAANGFFVAAVAGLARSLISDYWRLRGKLGLTRYTEPDIVARLAEAGFIASRAARNIGHNPARMTFLARPRAAAAPDAAS